MRTVLLLLASLLVLPGETSAAERRPNIIIVLADDLGWSDVGCYGGEIPTPHLDALAAAGLRFRQFYNNAVCGPSRASLLTGLYSQQIGHTGKFWNHPTDFRKSVTIAELLKRAGYRTLMIGKWQERLLPARLGFDRFFGPMCQGKISYYNEVKDNPFYLDEQRWPIPPGFEMTEAFNDHALRFVQEAAGGKEPFFLYLAHIAPHWPLHAREAEIAPHRERYRQHGWDHWRAYRFERQRELGIIPKHWPLSPRPAAVQDWKADKHQDWQAERMAVYAAQVASIDRGVGKLRAVLQKAGAEDNTLILFLSDNGAAVDGGATPTVAGFGFDAKTPNKMWRRDGVPIRPGSGPNNLPGPHDTFAGYGPAWANVSNTPFRNAKATAYEGGIRTPLIACWPAGIRARGKWSEAVGHVMDLMPTCLDLAQAKYPADLEGRKPLPLEGKSLAPAFRGEKDTGHELLAWNAPHNQALRWQKWLLVNAAPERPWELYDLDADATQTQNLAEKHPRLVEELAGKYREWTRRCANK